MSTGGDLLEAYNVVVARPTDALVVRTGISRHDASAILISANYDIEGAFVLWRRDNPLPEPEPNEKLTGGVELAASIPHPNPSMRKYAHVIPRSSGYELRLITHLEKYTEESFGFDYDHAMEDSTTRLDRLFVNSVSAVISQLASWGCAEDRLCSPDTIDSCLVNSPIDVYLDLEHLQMDDPTNTA